jgi:uncharacterized protein YfaA (DUF2138 family)
VVIDDLTAALTRAIEELTRPVDAIKHQAKTVTVGISRSDESVLQVPLVRDLLHVDLVERLDASTVRGILAGYRRRYQALSDAVTETEEFFRDDILAEQPIIDLLIDPILDLAERWRQSA